MYPVTLRDEIRTWVLIQGKSQRAAASHFGLSRNTVAKLLLEEPAASVRQYQRQAPCQTPVRDAALPHIEKWLTENEWLSRWAPKQCWTAHRMWVELRKLGIPIGESTVRMYVQERRKPTKPAYIPLAFAPDPVHLALKWGLPLSRNYLKHRQQREANGNSKPASTHSRRKAVAH